VKSLFKCVVIGKKWNLLIIKLSLMKLTVMHFR